MTELAFKKDLSKYLELDDEELLSNLSVAELSALETEIDPDNTCLDPCDRAPNQTNKDPTGPFNRQKLLDFLEDEAKQLEDRPDVVPYTGEKKGKKFIPKDPPKPVVNHHENEADLKLDEDLEDFLQQATEEDLVDIAGSLGLHSIVNQVQFHAAVKKGSDRTKFTSVCGSSITGSKNSEDDAPNVTDVEKSIQMVKDSDPSLTELNLNNIKSISLERWKDIADGLKKNTTLLNFSMASTLVGDNVAQQMAEALKSNRTLQSFNIESNFISGRGLLAIINAIADNNVLIGLRLANQRSVLGNKIESQMADLLEKNKTLLKFGLSFESQGPRRRAHYALLKNIENARQKRVNGAS